MEPIAVIGLGCRFPGAANPTAFWDLLCKGQDVIRRIPKDRCEGFAGDYPWGGFLDDVDLFDASFFGISPREAKFMDPQQRLLLEVAYEALEDAGQVPQNLAGSSTGIFVGLSNSDYGRLSFNHPDAPNAYLGTGNAFSVAASRLAYILDLRGPSMAVDTACSSSLVAVHLGCQSLDRGECSLVLAGGVNLILSPELTQVFAEAQMLSPDGRCKAFDEKANGYVRSEGCGVVVLKRLADAIADGDPIHGLIRGSAINQDGRSNGLTAPNGLAQEAVIRQALEEAGVHQNQIAYVEAHGTGTPLGDPIEALALGAVLGSKRNEDSQCAIGTVKSNIGHLEAAAGIAGLIKVILSLKHRKLPPSLHFEKPNPHIPFEELSLRVVTRCEPLPTGPALAGVSSFGFSGTNAHVILEEAPPVDPQPECHPKSIFILPLSAHSPVALLQLGRVHQDIVCDVDLANLCYTSSLRRTHQKERLAIVFHTREELVEQLAAFQQNESPKGLIGGGRLRSRRLKLVFVFPGQGPQWWAMGRSLWLQEPVFQEAFNRCDTLFARWLEWTPLAELQASESQSRLGETIVAQPTIFALQIALTALWQSWGVTPDAVVGHSLGEVAAAYVAGVLSLEDAVRIVSFRAQLMQQATGQGRMTAVEVSASEASAFIKGYEGCLSIAAINSPTSVVLSGEQLTLEEVVQSLTLQGKVCRPLRVDYAFHCPQMKPFQKILVDRLTGLEPKQAMLPIASTVTGAKGALFDAQHWGDNIRNSVRFAEAVECLLDEQYNLFLEISPHPVLAESIAGCLAGKQAVILPSMQRQQVEHDTLFSSLGRLYTLGYPIDWKGLYVQGEKYVPLPSCPWQRERYWLEPLTQTVPISQRNSDSHPLLGSRIATPLREIIFEAHFSVKTLPFLDDHRLHGVVVVPAASHIAMVLAAAQELWGEGAHWVEDVLIYEPFTLLNDHRVQLVLTPKESDQASFQLFSCEEPVNEESSWKLHASGNLGRGTQAQPQPSALTEVQQRCLAVVPIDAYYQKINEAGLNLGPTFQGIQQLWQGDGHALGRVHGPEPVATAISPVHPAYLDACFQVVGASMPSDSVHSASGDVYIPMHIGRVQFHGASLGPLGWCHASFHTDNPSNRETFSGDYTLFNEEGQVVMQITGLLVKRAPREALLRIGQQSGRELLYELVWHPQEVEEVEVPPTERGSWLIFADSGGLGLDVARNLEKSGENCFLVYPDAIYGMHQLEYRGLESFSSKDFEQLLENFGDRIWCGVVYLWGLEDGPLVNEKMSGMASVLHLVQALAQHSSLPKLWLVTRGSQAVLPGPLLEPGLQAALWGFGRVMALEHPELWGGIIDLDPMELDNAGTQLSTVLLQPRMKGEMAFRQDQRYVPRLIRSPLQKENSSQVPDISAEATYLITGGLGGLGLKVASWLVTQGARYLVLIGRNRPSMTAQECVQELEQMGAKIVVFQADVTDTQQMAGILTEISSLLPALKGVVHAAGVLEDGMLVQQEWSSFHKVLAPKVDGAWTLHQLTQTQPLDFFVLFSSVSTLLGTPGQGNYAAANAFLDALAYYRISQGLPALSINWGPWDEAGMAASLNDRDRLRLRSQGIGMIPPAQGLEIFGFLLGQPLAQVGVLNVKWPKLLLQLPPGFEPSLLIDLAQEERSPTRATSTSPPQQSLLLQQLAEVSAEKQGELLVAYICEQIVRILHLDPAQPLDLHQPLNELGFDSLMTTELKGKLETELGIPIPVVILLQNPSVVGLTKYLSTALSSQQPGTSVQTLSPPVAPIPTTSSWLIQSTSAPDTHLRLFCFHYLGGGASAFRKWSAGLPNEVEVCCLQLPGRENRILEPAYKEFDPLVAAIVEALYPYLDRPFAFYGHSMGALISFEVARHLRRKYDRAPVHLFAAAYYAPHLPSPFQAMMDEQWTEARWLEYLPHLLNAPQSLLENTELMQALLPTVRADAEVLGSYRYVPDEPLPCPIWALGGLQDNAVQENGLQAWAEHTQGGFQLQLFPGQHLFLENDRDLLLDMLSRQLLLLLEGLGPEAE
jgi:acyl transferase domain-containing protein/surfactin synthase thioesterase subunit/acyl carrier protein